MKSVAIVAPCLWRLVKKMNRDKMVKYLAYSASLPLLTAMFLSFPIGGYTFFSEGLPSTMPMKPLPSSLPIFFFGQLIYIPLPVTLTIGQAFLVLWMLYLALFSTSFFGPKSSLSQAVKELIEEGPSAIFKNMALLLAVVFPVFLLGFLGFEELLNRIGLPVGQLPEVDLRENFFLLSYAPLIEEFGFRISIIGIAGGIVGLKTVGGIKGFLRGLWRPSDVVKGKSTAAKVNIYLLPIMLSSMLFGIAHIMYSTDWGIGKAVSAGAAGFIIAIIYVVAGLPAAILLHWAFNYFSASFYYFDRLRGLPPIELVQENVFRYTEAYVEMILLFSATLTMVMFFLLQRKSAQHL